MIQAQHGKARPPGRGFKDDAQLLSYDDWRKKNGARATRDGYTRYRERYFRQVVGVDVVQPGATAPSTGVRVVPSFPSYV